MKKIYISLFMLYMCILVSYGQSLSSVKGMVSDSHSTEPISAVMVKIVGANLYQNTQADGSFELKNVPLGDQLVRIEKKGYYTQEFPVKIVDGESIDLGLILLNEAVVQINDLSVISLTDDQLSEDEGGADNTAGLLQASRDVFLNAAAFEFSPTFFRARGYNSENGSLLINGIEMNKLYNGRPQWSNWGGLNDVMRNQVFTNGLAASENTFGGVAGTNNITMRASEYARGGRVSLASSNRSYSGRLMVSYSSGLLENGWAYSFSASRRFAHEGYNDASLYDSNSFFAAIEKVINDKHSLNFTAFYTPNRRGKSSPNTQEVYDLKDTRYNAYWGTQRGEKRNSRERHIEEPVFMLNHFWNLNDKASLNSNISFQTGKVANSRIDHGGMNLVTDSSGNDYLIGGGANPDPTYYQKLPSYFLRDVDNPDYSGAYLATEAFQNDGQMDWQAMYDANLNSANLGGNSIYALYDDRNDDTQFTINSILRSELSDNIDLNGSVSYRNLKSENFGAIKDLLGGTGFLNVDSFSETLDEAQNDLQNPNRIVQVGDRFRYNFEIDASIIDAFAQAQFQYNKIDFYVSGKFASTSYQRNGLYENGRFPGERSFGKSEKLNFYNASFKGGLTYKITGRHLINFNAGYLSNAPTIRNSFSNSRENNDVVKDLTSENITTTDLSYIWRTPKFQGRVTGFYTQFTDATEISFYYADGISFVNEQGTVESSAFVQEVLSGIDKRNIGMEVGLSYQATPTIKLKGAAAVGDYIYSNNPNLYLTSDAFDGNLVDEQAYLENYHVAGGPQQALSIGFEYRDPNYWWFGATGNHFSNGYLDISPLSRTSNFSTDPSDGQPFNDYDPEIAKQLLAQEQFDSYFLVNAVGGKSWRVDDYFIGFFASINNILNTKYKTGGFEQSRNANYRVLKDDKEREKPIFGPKYWYGYGATYYLNVYFRF